MHGRTFACNLTIDSFSGPCRAIFTYVPVPPFTEFATDAREGVKLYKKKLGLVISYQKIHYKVYIQLKNQCKCVKLATKTFSDRSFITIA